MVLLTAVTNVIEVREAISKNGQDFYIDCLADLDVPVQGGGDLPDVVSKLQVGGATAETIFTHCLHFRTGDINRVANELLTEFGLGLGHVRVRAGTASRGIVFVLLNRRSTSSAVGSKRPESSRSADSQPSEKRLKTGNAVAAEETLMGFAKRSHRRKGFSSASSTPKSGGSASKQGSARGLTRRSSGSSSSSSSSSISSSSGAGEGTATTQPATPARGPDIGTNHTLYDERVGVLHTRLKVLLPTLQLERLSDKFVQQKLEEFMQIQTGRLANFAEEIGTIWREYYSRQQDPPSQLEPRPFPKGRAPAWPWEKRGCVYVDSSPERGDVVIQKRKKTDKKPRMSREHSNSPVIFIGQEARGAVELDAETMTIQGDGEGFDPAQSCPTTRTSTGNLQLSYSSHGKLHVGYDDTHGATTSRSMRLSESPNEELNPACNDKDDAAMEVHERKPRNRVKDQGANATGKMQLSYSTYGKMDFHYRPPNSGKRHFSYMASSPLEPELLVEVEKLDEWGLQVALDEIADALPAQVVEILEALLVATPTSGVLEDGDYKDAFSRLLGEPPESIVGGLARKVCAVWKGLAEAEAMALLKGYAAVTQMQEETLSCTSADTDLAAKQAAPDGSAQGTATTLP